MSSPIGGLQRGERLSASRRLLIFVPLVVWLAWLGFRVRKMVAPRALVLSMLAGIAAYSLSMGAFENWWGGYSYGARFQTDLLLVFALLAAIFVHAAGRRADCSKARPLRRPECIAMLVAAAIGAVLNAVGAWSQASHDWNKYPQSLLKQPMRAFDIAHSQFLVGLIPSLLERETSSLRQPPLQE